MSRFKLNQIISIMIATISIYSAFIIFPVLPKVLDGWRAFFDYNDSIYPVIVVVLTALVPIGMLTIAYWIFVNKHSFLIFPILLVSWFLFISNTVYVVIGLVLVWWLSNPASQHLTKKPG